MVTCTKDLTRVNLEARETEKHNRQTRKIIIALIMVAFVEGVALVRMLGNPFSCESNLYLVYPLFFLICDRSVPMSNVTALQKSELLTHSHQMSDDLLTLHNVKSTTGISEALNEHEESFPAKNHGDESSNEENPNDTSTIDGSLSHLDDFLRTKVDTKRTSHYVKSTTVISEALNEHEELFPAKNRGDESNNEENPNNTSTVDGSLSHLDDFLRTKVDRKRPSGTNLLRQTNMIWGTRRKSQYDTPTNIIEQRMLLRDSSISSITEIPPFNGNLDIAEKVTAMLLKGKAVEEIV